MGMAIPAWWRAPRAARAGGHADEIDVDVGGGGREPAVPDARRTVSALMSSSWYRVAAPSFGNVVEHAAPFRHGVRFGDGRRGPCATWPAGAAMRMAPGSPRPGRETIVDADCVRSSTDAQTSASHAQLPAAALPPCRDAAETGPAAAGLPARPCRRRCGAECRERRRSRDHVGATRRGPAGAPPARRRRARHIGDQATLIRAAAVGDHDGLAYPVDLEGGLDSVDGTVTADLYLKSVLPRCTMHRRPRRPRPR